MGDAPSIRWLKLHRKAEWERIVEDDPPVKREDGADGEAEKQNAPEPTPPGPIPGLKLRFSDEADAVREA